MNRVGNIYDKICSIENLKLADIRARKGKKHQYGIIIHDKNRDANIMQLHEMLKNKTYKTSPYTIFKVYEPKEREVYQLPYFPDRIAHHAIMNVMEKIFVSTFTSDTYSCIKGRGIKKALDNVRIAIRDTENTKYCLKLDVKKFYPSINHDILKELLKRKIKDVNLLWLLGEIIDSATGLPIGNYLSQYFANFFLTYFDHWIKECIRIKDYFRYADDMVIFHGSKAFLHKLLFQIRNYLSTNLKLDIKENYQIFPISARGVDFLGYKIYHTHTNIRKRIKQDFARMLKRNPSAQSIASYYGWLSHCDSKHLLKKLLYTHEAI